MPVKKRNSKLFLERLKPGGHVRLHRIQLDGCSRNDACLGNGGKYLRSRTSMKFSDTWAGRERDLLQQLHDVVPRYSEARANHEFDMAAVIAGESAGLIHDVRPAGDIVHDIVREMREILGGAVSKGKPELAAVAWREPAADWPTR
jgi:hypothetical protein